MYRNINLELLWHQSKMTSDLLYTMVKEEIKSNSQNLSIDKWIDIEKLEKINKKAILMGYSGSDIKIQWQC